MRKLPPHVASYRLTGIVAKAIPRGKELGASFGPLRGWLLLGCVDNQTRQAPSNH